MAYVAPGIRTGPARVGPWNLAQAARTLSPQGRLRRDLGGAGGEDVADGPGLAIDLRCSEGVRAWKGAGGLRQDG